MNHSEILEIKKRLTKTKVSFSRIAGCYVGEEKEKICTFAKNFLNLEEDEFFMYLEISNKVLSGRLGNNIMNVEIPLSGSARTTRDLFKKVVDSEGKDDDALNEFYDCIIENYDEVGKYLIILFFDSYDVPMKTTDGIKLDESEEVFDYFLCALCPVELSKNSLAYLDSKNDIGLRSNDWLVSLPTAGMMFPAFNDRSTDINSAAFYFKNPKMPCKSLITSLFCVENPGLTSAEKKIVFDHVIRECLADGTDETVSNALTDIQYDLHCLIEEDKEINGDDSVLKLDRKIIENIVADNVFEKDNEQRVVDAITSALPTEGTDAKIFVSTAAVKQGKERAEKKSLVEMISEKNKEIETLKGIKEGGSVMISTSEDIECIRRTIDGTEYILVPANRGDVYLNDKKL